MSSELKLARMELHATGAACQRAKERARNLGDAILLFAIGDYCSVDEETHHDAEQFLYPQTTEWLERYEWAVALSDGLNAAWLRETLDRFKGQWDEQRSAGTSAVTRRRSNCTADRKGEGDEARKCS